MDGHVRWPVVEEVLKGGGAVLPEIALRLSELSTELLNAKGDRVADLLDGMARLKTLQAEVEGKDPIVRHVPVRDTTQDFIQDWAEASTDEERREIFGDAIERVWVVRGRPGRGTPAQLLARLVLEWRLPEQVGPIPVPTDEELVAAAR